MSVYQQMKRMYGVSENELVRKTICKEIMLPHPRALLCEASCEMGGRFLS